MPKYIYFLIFQKGKIIQFRELSVLLSGIIYISVMC